MPSRNSNLPKYVYVQRIKGKTYYRFRRVGGGSVRLPDDPDSDAFRAAYAKLRITPQADIGRYTEGSVAHTIEIYQQSAKFSQLAPGTQRDYKRYLVRLDRSIGECAIATIDGNYVHELVDKMKDTPGAANHAVAVISALFDFAKRRKLVTVNPAEGVERLKGGDGYLRWPVDQLELFRKSAYPMMRLAFELGVYTGQRLSDVIRLAWSNYDGKRLRLRQQKTGVTLSIPVHPDLAALLNDTIKRGLTILTSRSGCSFHSRVFSRDFLTARTDAGMPLEYSFHGLRHTAAAMLAEAGCSGPEIMAITGHKSLKMVEHYIRQAAQEVQADRAIARLPIAKPTAK